MQVLLRLRNIGYRGAMMATGLFFTNCDGYPLKATFCDNWCRVTLTPGCDGDPVDCVTDCERSRVTPSCEPFQQKLLTCYEEERASLSCPVRFDTTRVANGACTEQRDAWFSCESPEITPCLSSCRSLQLELYAESDAGPTAAPVGTSAAPTSSVVDAGAFDAGRADGGATDAGADELASLCPEISLSCEQICWTFVKFANELSAPLSPKAAFDASYL